MLSLERLLAEAAEWKPSFFIPVVKRFAIADDLNVTRACIMSSVMGDVNLLRVPYLKPVHHQYLV